MRYRQWGNLVFLLDHGCTLTGVIVPLNYGSIVATSDLYRQLKSTMRLFWIESFPHGTLMPDMPSVAELILIIAVIILTTDKLAYAAHSGAECYGPYIGGLQVRENSQEELYKAGSATQSLK
jgi:hypothetical protein